MRTDSKYQIDQWLELFKKTYPIVSMRYDTNIPVTVEINATNATAKDLNAKIFQVLNEKMSIFIGGHAKLLETLATRPIDTNSDAMETYLRHMIHQLSDELASNIFDPLVMHKKLTALNRLNLDADAIVNQDVLAYSESRVAGSDSFLENSRHSDQLLNEMSRMRQEMEQYLIDMDSPSHQCSFN